MSFDQRKPCNDLPLLPPKADIEIKAVLRKTITAGGALAELKGLGEKIPNQSILVNSLILQEAKASSEIENIITTNDALFRAFTAGTAHIDPATKEVLRYREALWEGFITLKKRPVLTTNLFMDLEDFIHAEDSIDPLIKLAVIHYQFESIHPFSNGNGRTGRIINILYLLFKGLLELSVLYLSKYIIENKSKYYNLLRRIPENTEWEPWILYILDTVENTALFTKERISAIRDLMEKTCLVAKEKLPGRVYSKELIVILFRQPYTKGRFIVDAGIAKRKTAAEYLKEFEEIGIVEVNGELLIMFRGRDIAIYLNETRIEIAVLVRKPMSIDTAQISESTLKQTGLSRFRGIGYNIAFGQDLSPGESGEEGKDYNQLLLRANNS